MEVSTDLSTYCPEIILIAYYTNNYISLSNELTQIFNQGQ